MKAIKKSNPFVVVEPRSMGNFGSIRTCESLFYGDSEIEQARLLRDKEDRCKEIAEQIRRHVDFVDHVRIEYETEALCSHCGWRWTEESDTYNGGCCSKDEEANPEKEVAGEKA